MPEHTNSFNMNDFKESSGTVLSSRNNWQYTRQNAVTDIMTKATWREL